MRSLNWFILVLTLVVSQAQAEITATVDRTRISELDLLTLTIRVSDSQSGQPDFSSLEKDFDIVNNQSHQNSSYTFINGQQTSRAYVDYILNLRPKRLGNLKIPGLTIDNEQTQPITIQVIEQTNAMRQKMQEVLFFETVLDSASTYVQAQLIYSVRLYYSESISGDFPAAPDLEDAVVEILEEEKRYETILNNKRFYVLEKKYAIFPQKSGSLVLSKETFVGTRGRGGLFSARQRVSAISSGHTIEVRPVPKAFNGDHWLPGKNLTAKSKLNLPEGLIRVGDPLNQVISLSMDGVSGVLLPEINLQDLPGTKIYVDQPIIEDTESSTGISTLSRTTIGIVPTQAGKLTLPEIRIPWWNIQLDRQETAIIPAQTLEIKPSISTLPASPVIADKADSTGSVPELNDSPGIWKWLSIGLLTAWLLTLLGWYSTRTGNRSAEDRAPVENTAKADTQALLNACQENDAQQAHQRLLVWLRSAFPQHQSATMLAATKPRFAAAFNELEKVIFSGNTAEWQGKALTEAIKGLERPASDVPAGSPQHLAKQLNMGL